jgi:hypothetical protein
MLFKYLAYFLSTLFLATACQRNHIVTVQELARKPSLPLGAPNYSDICFSSRWERPRNEQDSFETFSSAKRFHATYLNWVYTTNPRFIKKADSLGYRLQVALSPTMQDLPFGSNAYEKGRMVDKNGAKVAAPWMKSWGTWWGCVNHPDFQETYLQYIKAALDAGAYGFHVDDPAMGALLTRNKWEDICYCPFCLRKADSLGLTTAAIQEASVLEFHQSMKAKAEIIAGRAVPFSTNNFDGDWQLFPFNFFDFGLAELPERRSSPEYIYASVREARQLGKAQVYSFTTDKTWMLQKMIAATYASGGNMLVPWDVWQNGGRERFFGKPSDFAPYFGFVRANARWLEGYEDAFYANAQDEFRFVDTKSLPVSFEAYRGQVHAFVRAKPGDLGAPVVIHLVDWYVLMQPFEILLNEGRFFKKGIGAIELLTPVEFDEKAHELAEATGDFQALSKSQRLDYQRNKNKIQVLVPKLEQHWGILVVWPKK